MKGIWARVYLIYPLAIPLAITLVSMLATWLASVFPAYFLFDTEAQRITVSITVPEIVAGVGAGLVAIWGVFSRFGVKP